MKSITLFTEEIDDFDDAVDELKEQMEDFELLENSVGIVYSSADHDMGEMMEALAGAFDFPIIGATSLAMLNSTEGYCDSGITMIVMTADDCQFYTGMAQGVTYDNYEEKIAEAYKDVKAGMEEQEKLIIAYATKIPGGVGDDICHAFDKVSGNVPVYGALASDGFTFRNYAVFDKEHVDMFGVAFILVTGNVKPLVACEFSITNENGFSAVVTKSEGNMIYELNKGKFVEVLKAEGLESGNSDVIMEFVGSPFIATLNMDDGNKIRVMRFITTLDQESKSGAFLGGVPEGSGLGMAIINRSDVEKSIQECLKKMLDSIAKETGYEYSTFILNSCAGRYLLLSRDHDAEARAYKSVIPENVSAAGFYSYGEFAPVYNADGDKFYNVFHNSTFTILAM